MKNLFDKVFTLDEFRFSFIILVGFIITGFAMYMYKTTGDVSDNVTSLLKVIVITVGTVNGVKGATNLLNGINKVEQGTKPNNKGDVQ